MSPVVVPMDPNATLREIRELIATIEKDVFPLPHQERRLMELVSLLDGWMSGGGRLPDDWQVKR